jgi:hypothetical protein
VADRFVLMFRAIAVVSSLVWISLTCDGASTVDSVDRVTQFTEFQVPAHLGTPPGTNEELTHRLVTRAEQTCLVTRLEKLWGRNIAITTRLVKAAAIPTLLTLVRSGKLEPGKLVTHRFELGTS